LKNKENSRGKKTQSQKQDITLGYLVEKEKYWDLLVSEDLPHKYSDTNQVLLIYAIGKSLSRITCYPIREEGDIWKLKLVFKEVKEKTIEKVGKLIERFKMIHTTGISKKGPNFKVEDYFVLNSQDINIIKSKNNLQIFDGMYLIRKFQEMKEIKHVDFFKIEKL